MFLGLDATAWIAWTAIATFVLAVAATTAILVNAGTAKRDRRADDRKRAEDRDLAERRRQQDFEETERRRQEDLSEAARQRLAERTEQEDYQARQVLVKTEPKQQGEYSHLITISTPHAYPIKQADGRIASTHSGNPSIIPFGPSGDDPNIDNERTYYTFKASLREPIWDKPIIRFVDWHGNLYYHYRGYTMRFSQQTDWNDAFTRIDNFIRTGPKPD